MGSPDQAKTNSLILDSASSVFLPYVDQFNSYAKINKIDPSTYSSIKLSMKLQPLMQGVIGQCSTNYKNSTIIINSNYWAKFNELDKKTVLFHELSHCLLFLNHNSQIMNISVTQNDGSSVLKDVPSSIMNPFHVLEWYNSNELSFYENTMIPYYMSKVFTGSNQIGIFKTDLPHGEFKTFVDYVE